ncbi:MAG TPA: VOC family protein [Acidimicrobiales bacterium]|nr:VOC family protein [Acidimicrobiales bacterium]
MTVELNHTIVSARDKQAAAAFLADILGLEVAPPWGPFVPVHLTNGVSLDFVDDPGDIVPQHYAFLVDDGAFDRGLARLAEGGHPIWADPGLRTPGEINHHYGGRGVYFRDPSGHLLELITAPYGDAPE